MAEIIAIIVLAGSLVGLGVIVFRKIPILLTLPAAESREEGLILKLKRKMKELNPFKKFSYEILLQKVLYKIRILTLKADTKTWSWLQKLREKTRKKKLENDNYWEEIKKSIKKK
jgi:hypothetical protein